MSHSIWRSILTVAGALCLGVILALPASAEGDRKGKGKRKGRHHSVEQIFKKFDKNADDLLTADEVPERAWTRISKADTSGDGAVSKAELKEARKKRRGKRGGRRGGDKPPKEDA